MRFARVASLVLGFIVSVLAGPLHPRAASSTQQPVDVTYKIEPFTQAAGLVQQTYCSPSSYEPGLQLGDATFLWRIGDGDQRQRVNLYHSESLGIAVAIQGTNGSSTRSILNDFQYNPFDPDERYSQYYPKGAKIMNGFQIAYVKLVDDIFRALKKYKNEKNESRVTVIGHSQGAAIGLLAAMDIELRLDGGLFRSYLFGLPRVGNPTFASFVDRTIGHKLRWAINGRDWVPTVPIHIYGYQHPSNYIWIYPGNSTNWKLYPGQENVHGIPTVPRVFNNNDHQGIYFHTQIGGVDGECPARVGAH